MITRARCPPTGLEQIGAAPRRAEGIIARPQDAVFLFYVSEDFLLVGPMIAGGDDIDAQREELVGHGAGQAEAARRILAIGDHQVEIERGLQRGQFGGHHVSSGPSDNVAKKENVHAGRKIPFSVRIASSAISWGSRGSESIC